MALQPGKLLIRGCVLFIIKFYGPDYSHVCIIIHAGDGLPFLISTKLPTNPVQPQLNQECMYGGD